MNKKKLKRKYERDGYAIIRNVISTKLAKEIENHIDWLTKKHPNTRPEAFHHNMLIHDPFIHHILDQKSILDIVETIIGPNIALFGAHYIAKKPLSGQPVGWHQDGSYWPLEPMDVVSVWLAGTHSTKSNACMKVIPGTQNKRLMKPSEMIKLDTRDYVLDLAIHPDHIDESSSIDIALAPGDATVEGKIPGLAAKSGFLFIKALGQVGFYVDGAINWDIAILVGGFGLTLVLSQALSGRGMPVNPQQSTANKITPIMITGMFLFFPLPAGVLLYMVIANMFQAIQTFLLSREALPENLQKILDDQLSNKSTPAVAATPSGLNERLPFEPKSGKNNPSS